jgi:hypothetical protein
MKKLSASKRLQLNKETLTQLDLQNANAAGVDWISWLVDCNRPTVSQPF